MNLVKRSKSPKLIPKLDTILVKRSKRRDLIPELDMNLVNRSKLPKPIPKLDMNLVKRSKKLKLIPKLDMDLVKRSKNPKFIPKIPCPKSIFIVISYSFHIFEPKSNSKALNTNDFLMQVHGGNMANSGRLVSKGELEASKIQISRVSAKHSQRTEA